MFYTEDYQFKCFKNKYALLIKYLTTEPLWRKGQKSTLKETNNDALTIFKVHVYLAVIPEKKLIGKYPESIIKRQ